jgi:UDP-3-O-[3-hydroxymyristoyl] N-acetylglucosamine deacetylase/3-hydroxyacyl-[acyl-carrier-protein] dehydratase
MYLKQHTIKEEVALEGVGLHTGQSVRILLKPAPEHHGFVFRRTDMKGQPAIPAAVENVVDSDRSTTIAQNGARVHQIEHLMAALSGKQIDNVQVEIEGPEPPALDGSAKEFSLALERAGFQEQSANREFYVIEEPIHYYEEEGDADFAVFPYDDYRVTVMVDYNSKVLGIQHATMVNIEEFDTKFAPSRTFCFLHELESLVDSGLIKGGTLENAIVIVEEELPQDKLDKLGKVFNKPDIGVVQKGTLNNVEMQFNNEPARHKLLDFVGDMALLGNPVKGQFITARPGHRANAAFAKKIKNNINQKRIVRKFQKEEQKEFVFDINAIHQILPHTYPFLLVDRILNFEEDAIEGLKNVTYNEPFFQGHFPGNPVMPGVLILEAMAQAGGILLLNQIENPENYWVYFVAINNARFKKPVIPGDQIIFKLKKESFRRNICKMTGKAYVQEQLACEADLVASLVPKN